MKKKDIKYILILLILLVFTVACFCGGIKDTRAYKNRLKNAVTVTATAEASHLSFREEVKWNSGAGDDALKEVTKVPYYTHSLTYTFEGKEYHCTTGGNFDTVELAKGTPVEITIDAADPEYVITEARTGKGDLFWGWFYLAAFLGVVTLWLVRRLVLHK